MERAKKDGVYSIGAVVKMLGVPAQTLRSWEDRYHQIVPTRSAGGQRLYSRDQVDQLRFILEELDRGMQPADAHRLLEERRRFPVEHERVPTSWSRSCSRSGIRFRRSSPSISCAPRATRPESHSTPSTARKMLEEDAPSLVVIDLLISGGAGQELCRLADERVHPGGGRVCDRVARPGSPVRRRRFLAEATRSPPVRLDGTRPAWYECVPASIGSSPMSDRLASGSARLDAILEGGLLLNGINLIMGRPGSGKTILAQQYLFHNATAERPALYLSTVSEPLEKILRYGQSLSFFDKAVVGTNVIYEDLGQA